MLEVGTFLCGTGLIGNKIKPHKLLLWWLRKRLPKVKNLTWVDNFKSHNFSKFSIQPFCFNSQLPPPPLLNSWDSSFSLSFIKLEVFFEIKMQPSMQSQIFFSLSWRVCFCLDFNNYRIFEDKLYGKRDDHIIRLGSSFLPPKKIQNQSYPCIVQAW